MKRWNFITGLTIILLLQLVMAGFCVWTARTLSSDMERLISTNFESIRAMRGVRLAVVRIDAQYRTATNIGEISRMRGRYDAENIQMQRHLATAAANVGEPGEAEAVARLAALVKDYLGYYEQYFTLGRFESDQFKILTRDLAQCASDITDVSGIVMDLNETAVLARRQAAAEKARQAMLIAIAIAVFSLGIYAWTSVRLTRSLFEPLRALRDSIVKIGQRQFDVVAPIESSEELAQIATTFNQMAGELRAFVAETDLRVVQANRMSRAILEALPYPIYIVDADFAVVTKNPRAAELSQRLGIAGVLPGAVRKAIDDAAALGVELVGDDLHRAIEIPRPQEQPGPVPTYLPQVFRMDSGKAGWAVLLVDVTKLRHFDLAKTKAIATLGHEVKTPVTSIRMALHLLLEEKIGPLTADQRELVQAGRDDCERLLTVLQALLELSRFESGRVTMRPVPTTVSELLAQADAAHGDLLRRAGTPFALLPLPQALPLVLADPIHVQRVLGNFLSNAAKYGAPGRPVTLRADLRGDGFVRLSVRNFTERPLTEQEQARVFEPFHRRAGESAEGTGLGLAICREIAATHNGRVGVWVDGHEVDFYLDLRTVQSTQGHAISRT